jgi:hypothetical protein
MHGSFGCRLRMTEGEGIAEGNSNASEKVTASQDDIGSVSGSSMKMLSYICAQTTALLLVNFARFHQWAGIRELSICAKWIQSPFL